jgi:ribonuclease P protein component
MLARAFRLSREQDFKSIFKTGRRFQGMYYLIRVLPNNRDFSRVSVVVSLKVSKKAVVRNRLKRQTRAIIEKFWNHITIPTDILITVHSGAVGRDYNELDQDLQLLFKKARL